MDTRQHTQAGPAYQYRTGWKFEKNNAECFEFGTRHTFTLSSAKSRALGKALWFLPDPAAHLLTHTHTLTRTHTHTGLPFAPSDRPRPSGRHPPQPGRHPPPPDGRPPLPSPCLPMPPPAAPAFPARRRDSRPDPWRDALPAAAQWPGHPTPLPPSGRRRVIPLAWPPPRLVATCSISTPAP